MSTIQVRIDEKLKKQVNKVLNDMGLDMSTAIKLYLRQIKLRQGIPFQILTENGLTIERENAILKASDEAERGINVTKPMTAKEFVAYLDQDED